MHENREHLPPDLEEIAHQLREHKAEASPLELDQIKLRAQAGVPRLKGRTPMKARLVTALVILGLVGSGGATVIASSDSGGGNSGNSQYCPPSSPNAGHPKNPPPGNACGHRP